MGVAGANFGKSSMKLFAEFVESSSPTGEIDDLTGSSRLAFWPKSNILGVQGYIWK
jgi:hypothetical protein